jgi:putative membrane protein
MGNIVTVNSKLLIKAFITVILSGLSIFGFSQKPDDSKLVANQQNEVLYAKTAKSDDALFLVDVAEINQIEIKLGTLAQKLGTIEDVKNLGKMMDNLHTSCMEELIELAKKEAIVLPTSLTDNGIEVFKNLSSISGTSFDKEYCDLMVNGYKAAIAEFDNEIKETKDSDIKLFATTTVLVMRTNLLHALACQKECENKGNKGIKRKKGK